MLGFGARGGPLAPTPPSYSWRSVSVQARRDTLRGQEYGWGRFRDWLQKLTAFAVLYRPAYPAAEFEFDRRRVTMASAEDVTRKIAAMWPDPAVREQVSAELHRYGQAIHEPEPERVRLAILKLCEARLDRLVELVATAKRDYRDVLMWAEYPSEGRALWAVRSNLSDEERRRLAEVRHEDRQQYRDWLKE